MENPLEKYPIKDFIEWFFEKCTMKGYIALFGIKDNFLQAFEKYFGGDRNYNEHPFYLHEPPKASPFDMFSSDYFFENIYYGCCKNLTDIGNFGDYGIDYFYKPEENDIAYQIVKEPIVSYLTYIKKNYNGALWNTWDKTTQQMIRMFLQSNKTGYEVEREMFIRLYFWWLSTLGEYDYSFMNMYECNLDYEQCSICNKFMLVAYEHKYDPITKLYKATTYTKQKYCPICKPRRELTQADIHHRFGNKCLLCGATPQPLNKDAGGFDMTKYKKPFFHLHHIVPKKEGGSDDLSNSILICQNCHYNYHMNPEMYSREYMRKLTKEQLEKTGDQ